METLLASLGLPHVVTPPRQCEQVCSSQAVLGLGMEELILKGWWAGGSCL